MSLLKKIGDMFIPREYGYMAILLETGKYL